MGAIITTVIAALLIATIMAAIKSHWLYIIAPKLYLNTPISDGQIITLTIYNAGLISEEDVAILLRPSCKFELIATSKSSLTITGNMLSIPKLSRLETVTVLLLIEGKAFDPVDIESIESKAAKGKIVEKKEEASALWHLMLGIPILLLLLTLPFAFGTVIGADMRISAFDFVNNQFELLGSSKQLSGYKNPIKEIYSEGKLKGAVTKSRLTIKTSEIVRRSDIITITTIIKNNTKQSLMTDGFFESSAGNNGPLSFWDSRIENFALAPEEEKSIKVKLFLPESLSVKVIIATFSFKNFDGDTLRAEQIINFN